MLTTVAGSDTAVPACFVKMSLQLPSHSISEETAAAPTHTSAAAGQPARSLRHAIRSHWPKYLMEAACLGLFMLSACFFTVLLEQPTSPMVHALPDGTLRRVPIGLAMGGRRSVCSPRHGGSSPART